MRVAIITATIFNNLDWLRQCHASVMAQTHPCTHILLSDGLIENRLTDFQGQYIGLAHRHNDSGDTLRALGACSAFSQGFDAVAWLDDDNWFYPNHIASLVDLHQKTLAPVCTSNCEVYTLDGLKLGPHVDSDGINAVDANCYFITREAQDIASLWAKIPSKLHSAGDFLFFWPELLKSGVRRAHSGRHSLGYRATRSHLYHMYGVTPPAGIKDSFAIYQQLKADGFIDSDQKQKIIRGPSMRYTIKPTLHKSI